MKQTAILDEKTALQRQLEALQAERSQLLLENSFLRRATADLNFHQNAHDGIIYLNARHEIIYANPYFLEMLGLDSPEQILNKPFPSFMWGNPGDEAALVQNIKSDGFVREQELALYDQHGQPIFAVCSAVASRDEAGRYLGAEIMLCNVTGKRAAQAELGQQRDLLEAILASSVNPILVLNGSRQLIRTNPTGLNLFELAAEDLPQPFRSLLVKQGLPTPSIIELETKLLKDELINQEITIGDRNYILQVASLSPRQTGWICFLNDITERKQTEDDLRATASRLKALLGNLRAGVLVEDEAKRIVHINQTFCDIFGIPVPPQTLIGVDCSTSAEESKHLFVEPKKFTRRIAELLRYQNPVSGEELPLVDGRMLERDYIPIFLDDTYVGHLWQYRDITARKQAEHALRESKEHYRMLTENANDLIAKVTPTGVFTYVSPASRSLLGYEPAELLGQSFYDFIHPDDLVEVQGMVPPLFDPANAPSVFTLRLLRKGGREVWLESSSRAGRDPAGEGVEIVVVARDVTERKVYEAALQRAYDEMEQRVAERTTALTRSNRLLQQEITERHRVEAALEDEREQLACRVAERTSELSAANAELARAARLKDEFLASMSHELRTPLNAILGLSEALQEQAYGPVNEMQLKSLTNIEASGRHLLALINDILDVSKIEAGKMELELAPILVQSICEASLGLVKQSSFTKQIKLNFAAKLDDPDTLIQADGRRLKQMLVNLLSNAVKFTPEGGEVGLEVWSDSSNQAMHFTVWDTGIGISAEQLPRLFKPFVQLDSSLSRRYAGTGLGLVLVQRMTEMHGGSLTVDSEVGQGSRFTISLPWQAQAGVEPNEPFLKQDQPVVNRPTQLGRDKTTVPRILLAEDNETNIFVISGYLQKRGYQVVVTRTGGEAVASAKETPPDLILMDVQMPEMDGLEATRLLRTDKTLRPVPIIALTALAMPGDERRCMEAGADAYITKPVSLKGLVSTIEHHLAKDKPAVTTIE